MIKFHDWELSSDSRTIGYQYDHNTRVLLVTGDLPEGWRWELLVQVRGNFDILPLEAMGEGFGVKLTRDQLCVSGFYNLQLRGTLGDQVRHTNQVSLFVGESMSGDARWPELPTEFTKMEERVKADADRAGASAGAAADAAEDAMADASHTDYVLRAVTLVRNDTEKYSRDAERSAKQAWEAQQMSARVLTSVRASEENVTAQAGNAEQAAQRAEAAADRAEQSGGSGGGGTGGGAQIDDTAPAADKVYSSQKVGELLDGKQPKGAYATSTELAQAVETQAAKDAEQDAAISGLSATKLDGPAPGTEDEGKVLTVVDGKAVWMAGSTPPTPPTPSTAYHVTYALTKASSSNREASVKENTSYTTTLTADEGLTLSGVSVTMGGKNITAQAWKAPAVTISAVTGDVVITAEGVSAAQIDTSPVIEVSGKGINNAGRVYKSEAWGYTKFYETSASNYTLLYTNSQSVPPPTSNAQMTPLLDTSDPATPFPAVGCINPVSGTGYGVEKQVTNLKSHAGLRATLVLAEKENAYLYETDTGNIIFAGKNTPYYGMKNVGGTVPEAPALLSLDNDIQQNYNPPAASVLDAGPDMSQYPGVQQEYAKAAFDAYKEMMIASGGDFRKIPIILTADQHGRRSKSIFDMLGKMIDMYRVSKIANLGDTVSVEWNDADPEHPLLACDQLERWRESISAVPMSKQLNIYGNHDVWYGNWDDPGNPIATRYPQNLDFLYQYFRNIYARRIADKGYFSVKDDQYNVKYVCPSGFGFGGGVAFKVSAKQMDWLIRELSAEDGYDIIMTSHVPLYYQCITNVMPTGMVSKTPDLADVMRVYQDVDTDALFNARRDKTSGTIVDSEGKSHKFDFSKTKSDILCGLHGHVHEDAYNWVGGNGLLDISFDWFNDNTVHFVLVDKIGKKVKVWKIDNTNTIQRYDAPMEKPVL